MPDFIVPCETLARLANVLKVMPHFANEWFNTIRIDNGCAVASNRIVMAVERLENPNSGICHIIADKALIAQCAAEAPFKSDLVVTVIDELKYATAKTTLGYVHPGNACLWSETPNDYDRWRSIIALDRAKKSVGGMFWETSSIANLAASSPSGRLVFEEFIDCTRPTIVRDINDYGWFGVFNPYSDHDRTDPATLPNWFSK